ncbi:MAG: hypothetical protein V4537_01275 [Pseudomonadota bacterium]
MSGRFLLLALGASLAGCTSMSGFPQAIADPKQEDAEVAPYLKASAITDCDTAADRVACRNTLIDARLRAVDLSFYRFQRKIYRQDAQVGMGSGFATLALDSVAAITGTRALAAGAGLLTGGRDAYQKQVVSASLPLLFEEMIAKRHEVLLRIRQGQMLPVAHYSIFQALDDISEYELAGSLPAAAAELRASTGTSARTARAKLDAFRMSNMASMAAASPAPVVPASGIAPAASPAPPTTAPTMAAPTLPAPAGPSASPALPAYAPPAATVSDGTGPSYTPPSAMAPPVFTQTPPR